MIITYTCSQKPNKEIIAVCDESAKGFQDLIVEATGVVAPKGTMWAIWLLSRFYKRKVTETTVEYNFYLLRGK